MINVLIKTVFTQQYK